MTEHYTRVRIPVYDVTQESKRISTLRALFALRGWHLHVLLGGGYRACLPSGWSADLDDLAAVEAFAASAGIRG